MQDYKIKYRGAHTQRFPESEGKERARIVELNKSTYREDLKDVCLI